MHPQRSVITRALGTDADVDVDAFTVEARTGDVFLLCSDGLTTMVDADTIAEILDRNRGRPRRGRPHALIKAANDHGGDDNITAVLFAVADGDAERDRTVEAAAVVPAPDPDDEDTLHPEDNVAPARLQPPSTCRGARREPDAWSVTGRQIRDGARASRRRRRRGAARRPAGSRPGVPEPQPPERRPSWRSSRRVPPPEPRAGERRAADEAAARERPRASPARAARDRASCVARSSCS